MLVVSRAPLHPLLDGLVDRVWRAVPEPSADPRVEWILPTCRAQMILSPRVSVLVGPRVSAELIERRTDEPAIGVSLVAGAAAAFIGIGGHEICGITTPLDAVLPIGSLPDHLAEQSADEALDLIEAELVKWLEQASVNPLVSAVERAIRAGHPAAKTAEVLGVDRRRFVPEFRRIVGVAPKRYERICRFNRVTKAIRRPDAGPLASIAVEQGFADQAHLTREVRHFAQTSPSHIHRDGTDMVNHVEPDKIFKT